MASNIIGNRNSTPEASKTSLRPPSSRTIGGGGSNLRSSADMSGFGGSAAAARNIRPASEVLYNQQTPQASQDDSNRLGDQWIQDIEQFEIMLEEMATATLDDNFKAELTSIEEWFEVLSEAERTAATYALIQQTTQMQQRFFAQVLNQMSKSHPISGVLSPANFSEKDPMSSRLSDAMSKLTVDQARHSMGKSPLSPAGGNKRNSGMDTSAIHAMFPKAAAVIAQSKAEYAQLQRSGSISNRNSMAPGDRNSLITPSLPPTQESKAEGMSWRTGEDRQSALLRAKPVNNQQPQQQQQQQQQQQLQQHQQTQNNNSAQQQQSLQTPMGQFSQPPSASLRSPRVLGGPTGTIQSTTLNAPEQQDMSTILSPYNVGNHSWASLANTPMVPNFNTQQANTQNDMLANATAMRLAALSTVNNRIALDDVRKYRRPRSNEPQIPNQGPQSLGSAMTASGIPGINTILLNDQGQILDPQQVAAIQAQQLALAHQGPGGRRSPRPNSPGIALQNAGMGLQSAYTGQHNGYLAAFDQGSVMMNPAISGLIPNMGHSAFAGGTEGYLSDHSEIVRGRSPRGRRGSSKPPEDPTDISLLQDIPAWLRTLRLHKYTDNLKDLRWDELVQLDDKGLEARGVNALGARNKMLKVFEQVREVQTGGKL